VGRPVESIRLEIIEITDAPIAGFEQAKVLPEGEIGEIVVSGPMVTSSYFADPEHTALAKMQDADDALWHRMGDLGWRDSAGRVWFCGRKAHRVVLEDKTLFTVPLEKVFDAHAQVFRTALVGPEVKGRVTPALCVELEPGATIGREDLEGELRTLGEAHEDAGRIEHFLVHAGFPVDIRHNAKIGREELRRWAEAELG
jgi:acyl-CoA synthetase (AMP-forming)/AMP-acid ligase II